MIIVEGPDGAGKSTLVQSLQEKFGFSVGERATEDRSKLYTVTRQDTWTALSNEVRGAATARVQIWDRLFWSELVYADIVGRPVEFTSLEQVAIKRIMNALAVPIICCYPQKNTVLANVEGTEQMEGVHERISTIYDRYGKLFEQYPSVMFYDYLGVQDKSGYVNWDELIRRIEHYLTNRKERLWSPATTSN